MGFSDPAICQPRLCNISSRFKRRIFQNIYHHRYNLGRSILVISCFNIFCVSCFLFQNYEKLLAGEKAIIQLKLEHVSGIVTSMFLLEKQFRFETENRDKQEFRNNPILKFDHLMKNDKMASRPKLSLKEFFFCSHAHGLVNDGKYFILLMFSDFSKDLRMRRSFLIFMIACIVIIF